MSTLTAMKEILDTLGFEPRRIVVSAHVGEEIRQACAEHVSKRNNGPIQIHATHKMPDHLMVVFGAEGSFEVIQLLEKPDEECN